MRIKRRKNGYWYAIKDGRPVTLKTTDKATAQRRAADLERAPRGDSVSAIVTAYLSDKADKAGIDGMTDAANAFLPFFGYMRPDQIDRAQCRAYRVYRAGRSDGTIAKELGTLRSALRWADRNTPAIIELPKQPAPRDRFMTKSEFRRMFLASKMPHFKAWLALAWYTAGRKEAILSLTWDRVNLTTNKLILGAEVGNKGRAPLTPIHQRLARILRYFRAMSLSQHVVERAGKPVGNIRKAFAEAARRAGIEHITPHDVRRGAARHMIEAGVPLQQVSQFLGHRSVEVTARVYARFSSDYLMQAVEAL